MALDRNGDGVINDGTELFGNFSPQPTLVEKNGFEALAVFDEIEHGGDADGVLSAADKVFTSLQLWTDSNHDGVSQPSELRTVGDSGIREIDLAYKTLRRSDPNGNVFRYRSTAIVQDRSEWIYDVLLVPWRDTLPGFRGY